MRLRYSPRTSLKGGSMKTLLSIALIVLTFSAHAFTNRACNSVIEELGIDPAPSTDGTIRRYEMKGATSAGEVCSIQFLPDFCTFQLGSPLKKNEMYYLTNTDTSSIRITFRRGEKFFIRAVTKESREEWLWRLFTKTLKMEKFADGYRLKFSWKVGRFLKEELTSFTCTARKTGILGPQ